MLINKHKTGLCMGLGFLPKLVAEPRQEHWSGMRLACQDVRQIGNRGLMLSGGDSKFEGCCHSDCAADLHKRRCTGG
jgi:hypothetical protein